VGVVQANRETVRNTALEQEVKTVVVRMTVELERRNAVQAGVAGAFKHLADIGGSAASRSRIQVGRGERPCGSDRDVVLVIRQRLIERIVELITDVDRGALTEVVLDVKADILHTVVGNLTRECERLTDAEGLQSQ